MTSYSPVDQSNRIATLDILRGVALLGILLMNIPLFAMPDYFSEPFRNNPGDINFWFRAVEIIVFEGKMRALFSAIFGAGIILFTTNKEKDGNSSTALFYRRMGWLVVFGLLHAHVTLWQGDILYFYGVIGMVAFLFRKMKPVYLIMALPLVALLEFALSTSFYQEIRAKRLAYVSAKAAVQNQQALTPEQDKALQVWREVELDMIPNKEDAADHTRIMKSDYATVASFIRKRSWDGQTKYLIYGFWDPLALMLLGIALFKWGFFTGAWKQQAYFRMILVGYGLGFPLVIWNFYYGYVNYPSLEASLARMEVVSINWMDLIYPVQRILLMMAHASVVIVIVQLSWFRSLTDRLRAVGQMAFTNYIVHTLICTFFFFGYGLNYYAELEFYQIYYVVLAIWILQLIYSKPWLQHFLFGPLEWLWRSLTYWKVQPMLRKDHK